jgi:carboxypeptidase family protein
MGVRPSRATAAVISALILFCGESGWAASLHGRVCDLFGRPLYDAAVEVTTEGELHPVQVLTDLSGDYEIRDLSGGKASVSVRLRGFEEEKRSFFMASTSDVLMDFGLKVGLLADSAVMELHGAIEQADGAPASFATVTVVSAFDDRLMFRIRTNVTGRYSIRVPDPGQYLVYASKTDFAVSATTVVLHATVAREDHTINLILHPLHLK